MSDEHGMNHGDGHDTEHEHHAVNYTAIFGVLCVCTVLSICFDLLKESMPKAALIVLILGVAVCKATFVLLYFMHIKFETAWKYVLLAPTAVLACALPFALAPDIAFHYYNVLVPQGLIAAAEHGADHGDAGHASDAHAKDEHAAKHDDHKDAHHEPHGKTEKAHKDKTPAEKPHK